MRRNPLGGRSAPLRKPLFYGWVVLAGCTALSVLSGGFFYSRGYFLPELQSALGATRLQVSLAFTLAQATGALAAPALGRLLDSRDPRHVMAAGTLVLGAGYLLTASAASIWLLYAYFGLLSGVGWMAISNFGSSRVLVEWFRRKLGFALAVDVLGAAAAGVIVPPLCTWLIAAAGWRVAYGALGLITIATALPLILFVLRRRPGDMGLTVDGIPAAEDAETLASETVPWPLREVLRSRGFWAIAAVFGVMTCVWSGVSLHLLSHLRELSVSPLRAAAILSLQALVVMLAKPAVGWSADAFGGRRTTVATLVAQIAGVVVFATASHPDLLMLGSLIYGAGLSGLVAMQALVTADIFGRAAYGRISGYSRVAMLPVVLLASPLAGWLHDVFGDYRRAFWTFAALLALSLAAVPWLGADERREVVGRPAHA